MFDDVYELEVDDDLGELIVLSDRLRTEEEMARELVLQVIDPIVATGNLFKFRERKADGISPDVPKPFDRVDIAVAWRIAQQDAQACRLVLERDHSSEASLRVYRNTIAWLRFLSVRFPNELQREEFGRQLEERMIGLAALKARARMRFRLEIIEELENI